MSFGMSPKTHILGHIGRVTEELETQQPLSKIIVFLNRTPLCVLHLVHTSGILPLKRFKTSGVIYSLMDHLYCNSLKSELVVCVCDWAQIVCHSDPVISSPRSAHQASLLSSDVSGDPDEFKCIFTEQ